MELESLEQDALTELINIGVGRAAGSLGKMVGRQILLSVPAVEIMSRRGAALLVTEQEGGDLVAVRQDFQGAFAGRALLIFPQSKSLDWVRAVTRDSLSEEELADIEQEALAETGNIILKGCLGMMANLLQRSLTLALPEVLRGNSDFLFQIVEGSDAYSLVLFFYIDFRVQERNLRGYLAMVMDLDSLSQLKLLVARFIDRVVGTDQVPMTIEG